MTSRYGSCCEEGTIKVRLCHVVTGKPLKYSSLVNTLCHELAHLRYFHHGERFKVFYLEVLEYERAQRLYRPGHSGEGAASRPTSRSPAPDGSKPQGPVQLGLF